MTSLKMEKLFESYGATNEHLPSLYKYGKTVETIVVLGDSHEAVITFVEALKCNGKERKVLIHVSPTPEKLDFESVIYRHHTENNLLLDLSCDLLFIDSWHVYGQMKRELAKHSPTTNKYIIMHDTEVDAEHGESIRCKMNIEEQVKTSGFPIEEITKGIWPAIDEFVKLKQWKIKEKYSHNHGLTILRKQDDIDMCDYIEKEPWCVEVNCASYLFEKIGIPTSLERKDFAHAENCGLVLMLIPDCTKLERCVRIMKDQGQLITFIPPRTSISDFIKVGFRVERREEDRVIFRLKPRLPTITILYAFYPNVKHVEALKYFLKYVRKTHYPLKIVIIENKGSFTVKDLLDPSIIFLQRENENEDFGAFCHAVDELKIDMKEGDYLFMLNDTVWGPFFKPGTDWVDMFLSLFNKDVAIVGSTLICSYEDQKCLEYHRRPFPMVPTHCFMINHLGWPSFAKLLDLTRKTGYVRRSYGDLRESFLSADILSRGYNLNCVLSAYTDLDYRYCVTYNPADLQGNPNTVGRYFGTSVNPLEGIYVKYTEYRDSVREIEILKYYVIWMGTFD